MNHLKKDLNAFLIMFVVAMHGTIHASLRSLSKTKDTKIPQRSERAQGMHVPGTDYEYFTRHAQSFAEALMAHATSAKKRMLPQERVAIRHHLLQYMIDYKHAHDLPLVDLDGNEIPTALDHREIVFLDNLLATLTFEYLLASLSDTIKRYGILPYLSKKDLPPLWVQELFGTHTQELPKKAGDRLFAISEDGSTVVAGHGTLIRIYQFSKVSKIWKCRYVFNDTEQHITAVHPEGLTIIANGLEDDDTTPARIYRFNASTQQWKSQHFNHDVFFRPSCIAITRDGLTMVVGFDRKEARLYECTTTGDWELTKTFTIPLYIKALGIHDSTVIIIGSTPDGYLTQVYRFDRISNQLAYQCTFNDTGCSKSIAISSDCSTIACIPYPRIIQIHRCDTSTQRWYLHHSITLSVEAQSVFVTSDGSTVIIGLKDCIAPEFKNCTAQIYHCDSVTKRWELQSTINHTIKPSLSPEVYRSLMGVGMQDATVSLDGLTAVTRVMSRKSIHRVGLSQEEIQSLMRLIRDNFDVFLLLYNLHRKDEIYPHKPTMLNQEQLNTLAKLPLRAIKILVARNNLRIREQDIQNTLSALPERSSAATSSGTTEDQLVYRQRAALCAQEKAKIPKPCRIPAPFDSLECSTSAKSPSPHTGGCCTIS